MGTRAPGRPLTKVRRIIVHHSKTPDGATLSVPAIRKYHVETNGWADIGYHFLVEEVGDHVEVIVGRPLDRTGAHCQGHNNDSIGICFVGDFDLEAPSDHLLEVAASRLIVPLLRLFNLGAASIEGDRTNYPTKTCPGRMFDLERLRSACATAGKARL